MSEVREQAIASLLTPWRFAMWLTSCPLKNNLRSLCDAVFSRPITVVSRDGLCIRHQDGGSPWFMLITKKD